MPGRTARRRVLRITLPDGGRPGDSAPRADLVATEEPLGIRVDGAALSMTMRTPGDDLELAAGFLVSEAVVRSPADIAGIRLCDGTSCGHGGHEEPGNVADVTLAFGISVRPGARRSFLTTGACGICGKASIGDICALPEAAVAGDLTRFTPALLAGLPGRLREAQRVFSRTGGLHAAGLFTADGTLIAIREDVGRHNAVDKIVGWALLNDRLPLAGCALLVSGRASFELVSKAVLAGIPLLAAVSAPSSLAVELAEKTGLTLVGFLRGHTMNIYTGQHRVLLVPNRPGISSAGRVSAGHRGKADRMAEFTFAPLTPASFLDRAAAVFADRTAIVDGERRFTYRDMSGRCRRLAGALAAQGAGRQDRIAALCANSHVMLELHHAVPMAGGVLVTLNTRLSDDEMAALLDHSGASVLVATREFADRARRLAGRAGLPCFVAGGPGDSYEEWIAGAEPSEPVPTDERQLLAINYTSGTTGRPKGVMYHHRGAYLQATAMAYHARLGPGARYLWTLPMFHCNGWCFTWAVTAAGGTHVCLRAVDTAEIWRLLRDEGITHFSAAPTVLTMIAEDPAAGPLDHEVHVDTGGAPPSATLLARMESMNFAVTHLYGLTETYGPLAINEWQPEWNELPQQEQATLRARQGVANIIARPLRVLDDDGRDVPADGQAIGEIAVSGNDVMLGYYRDDEATREVTRSGCFLTGDLAVMHPGGYVEIRDRSKDIIISGGENIASVEVEQVLDSHPSVVESAVVGMPHERWGEVPVAFVTLRKDDVDADALAEYARERLARYKVPKRFDFCELPKTSTGKIQKNLLRARVEAAGDS